ncbi:MAG: S8 family serine peptidase [Anaerolineae bacterium]|nr:S8 family serine peptidase [Anaerolineae bacterium]
MDALDLVKLRPLMARTSGRPDVAIGLLDGPVAVRHPDLASQSIRAVGGAANGECAQQDGAACQHGTFIAGIVTARRGTAAPAICPGCSLLVRPIFTEAGPASTTLPSAAPRELAAAVIECIEAGARVLNLSVALTHLSGSNERDLTASLDYALNRGVLVVAAAGNQATVGSSVLTRHPWVIPVVGYDLEGRPMTMSNLSRSIGQGGLGAPGAGVISLTPGGKSVTSGGTSVAAPFVTGTIALLWSEFPRATAGQVKRAILQSAPGRRNTVIPPLLDAWSAYQSLRRQLT